MKRLLIIFSSISVASISASVVTSCQSSTPPVSVSDISKIMKVYKNDVISSEKTNVELNSLTSISGAIDSIYAIPVNTEAKTAEAVRNILDPVNTEVNAWILGQINANKSLIDSKDITSNITKEKLTVDQTSKMIATYFTVRTADMHFVNSKSTDEENKDFWATDLKDTKINEVSFNGNKLISVDEKNKPNSDNLKADKNYAVFDSNQLSKIQATYKDESANLKIDDITFLVSIDPDTSVFTGVSPVAFYIDVQL